MKLSILIPVKYTYNDFYKRLRDVLNPQLTDEVEVKALFNFGTKSIGYYRNQLLDKAKGEYLCFIDADDLVSDDYISTILNGLQFEPHCCSLRGIITTDGNNPELFEHSIKYDSYRTTSNHIKYERYPNHLNVIKSDIAKQFRFPEISHGEDTDWATQIHNSGLLKLEYYIDKVIYHYEYVSQKSY